MSQSEQRLFSEQGIKADLSLSAAMLQKETLHALGENAAAVLHELRGPLQAIRAHVQLLERKISSGTEQSLERNFTPIYQGIDHMNGLLTQFLRLSRLTPSALAQLDINTCIQEILPLLRSMAIMRNIELSTDIPAKRLPCLGDDQQLKRLIFNLFTNACDALEQQKNPHITISLKGSALAAALSIQDNGCGIGKDRLKHIWEPYYTSKPTGTGLGLPSCLAIAQEHNASLTVESKYRQGSCFTLQIPLSKSAAPKVL